MLAANASVMLYITLVYLTGAIPAEYYSVRKRPDYKRYQETTNRYSPWFAKKVVMGMVSGAAGPQRIMAVETREIKSQRSVFPVVWRPEKGVILKVQGQNQAQRPGRP